MDSFWKSWSQGVGESAGRNVAPYFMVVMFLFFLGLCLTGLFNCIDNPDIRAGVEIGTALIAFIIGWLWIRNRILEARQRRRERIGVQPLAYEEWRRARTKLKGQ
jgi:membrane associated rhomboid family serine protease